MVLNKNAAGLRMVLFALIFSFFFTMSASAKTLPALSSQQTEGCIFAGIYLEYLQVSKDNVLKKLNAIRKEAYEEGLVEKYVPLKWSSSLERIAQIRVAETTAEGELTHDRPNNAAIWVLNVDGLKSHSEDLAWTSFPTTENTAVTMWYAEKEFFNGKFNDSHYGSLINPYHTHIGLSAVHYNGETFVAAQLNHFASASEALAGNYGKHTQIIEVPKSKTKAVLNGPSTLTAGKAGKYALYLEYGKTNLTPLDSTWLIRNKSVAISGNGTVTAVNPGKTIVSASAAYKGIGYGLTAGKTLTVVPAKTYIASMSAGKKYFKVSWKKQTNKTTGYHLQYSKNSKFKTGVKTITVKNTTTSRKITGLKVGKYYVRIRTYKKTSDGTFSSGWSAAKTAAVK